MRGLPYHHDWPLLFEGLFRMRVHWFGRYAGYPDWRVGRDRLAVDMVSFFYVEASRCWCELNGVRFSLGQGELLIMRGGDEFEFGHDRRHPHVSLSACLSVSQGDGRNVLLERELPRRVRWPDPAGYVAEFEKVMAAMATHRRGRDFTVAGSVLCWLGQVLSQLRAPVRRGAGAMAGREVMDRILHAQRWATERLREPLTLGEWAGVAGMHPVYFGRVFKRETGRRPMQWLNDRRLQIAAQQLANTSRAIAAIAEDCGFSCPFYFSRVFRRHLGRSPSEFRRRRLAFGSSRAGARG